MKKMMLVLSLIFLFSGCSFLPSLKIPDAKAPTKIERSKKIIKCKGEIHLDDYGRVISCSDKFVNVEHNYNNKTESLTFAQRLGNFIGGLSSWLIIAIVTGLILFPTATITILIGRIRAIGKALYQTVRGVQTAKKNGGNYLQHLKEEQDVETKKIVNQMRAKI